MHLNKFIGIGTIVTEPEVKDSQNGKFVEFKFVMNTPYKNKNGEWDEISTYIKVQLWSDRKAQYIADKYKIGDVVMVEGELRQRKWEDENGNKREMFVIRAEKIKTIIFKDRRSNDDQDDEFVFDF